MGWLSKLFEVEIVSVGMHQALEIASDPDTRPYWDERHLNNPPVGEPGLPNIDLTDLHLLGWRASDWN